MKNKHLKNYLIWDSKDIPPNGKKILLWKGYSEDKNQHSILKYLEENSNELKLEYLNYIDNLGQVKIKNKKVVEHLKIDKNHSLWWMSLLVEKSPAKSKTPLNCLRLLAANLFLIKYKPRSIEFVSNCKITAESLSILCSTLKIDFLWKKSKVNNGFSSFKNVWKKFPHLIKAIIFLMIETFYKWPLKNSKNKKWFKSENSIFIFSYFFALDKDALKNNKFYSKQWEKLPLLLNNNGKNINWIHHYLKGVMGGKLNDKINLIDNINKQEKKNYHQFLDSFLSINIIIKTILTWLKIISHMLFINKYLKIKLIKNKNNYLWPLINEDWKESVFGKTLMQNILWSYLIDAAMKNIPHQDQGLYLCENQGWERAFIYYWKKYGHGELIAVPHATVRYWDLRYFNLNFLTTNTIRSNEPIADKIAVNGNEAWNNFKSVNQSMKKMVKVEALRYLHLNNFNLIKNNSSEENLYKILLLGDGNKNSTESMLKLLDPLALYFKNNWELTLKPHPANPIKPEDWPNLKFDICDSFLDQILPNYQIAISSIYTSASLEAYCAGLKIISVLDPNDFNFSPMRNVDGAIFVSKASELKKHLGSISKNKTKFNIDSFFWLDTNLTKWTKILNLK